MVLKETTHKDRQFLLKTLERDFRKRQSFGRRLWKARGFNILKIVDSKLNIKLSKNLR